LTASSYAGIINTVAHIRTVHFAPGACDQHKQVREVWGHLWRKLKSKGNL